MSGLVLTLIWGNTIHLAESFFSVEIQGFRLVLCLLTLEASWGGKMERQTDGF